MAKALPPLNAVRAFDVAARHLNFSRAAEELGVTQGAISKQVLSLEDLIGARLFERLPGGLVLTDEGRSLRESISPAFDMLGDAFQRFSRRSPRSNVFRLATVASFASEFMIPRLDAFAERFPKLDLDILTSDRLVDLDREEVDLSIRYGSGGWDGLMSTQLIDGLLMPVCSPELLARMPGEELEALIFSSRRIQLFSNNEWHKWSNTTGIKLADARCPFIMEHFLVALRAVLDGQGIALLPNLFVRKYLADGSLALFSTTPVDWHQTFHVAYTPNAGRKPVNREVIAWLHHEISAGN